MKRRGPVKRHNVVVSVPHSGTRTLVEHLNMTMGPKAPRKGHWHFMLNDKHLRQIPVHAHIPIRNPINVALSWAARDKKYDELLEAYQSMWQWLASNGEHATFYDMRQLPGQRGHDDDKRNLATEERIEWTKRICADVLFPNREFFAPYCATIEDGND